MVGDGLEASKSSDQHSENFAVSVQINESTILVIKNNLNGDFMSNRPSIDDRLRFFAIAVLAMACMHATTTAQIPMHSPDKNQALLNEPIDISSDFHNFSNTYYLVFGRIIQNHILRGIMH